jgi:CTP synthase
VKALDHAGMACGRKINIKWIEASDLEEETSTKSPIKFHEAWKGLCSANGILVPGGFGERGTEGKIAACKWARENKVPYLGICLGLQVVVMEVARNVCNYTKANSTEFDPDTKTPVVIYMPEISKTHLGGTMRLGARQTLFMDGTESSPIRHLYAGNRVVVERHRHRYEVNPEYVPELEKMGLRFIGRDETGERMEIIEMVDHPYMVGVQYHPEYLSRPLKPSPPFVGLVAAAGGFLKEWIASHPNEQKSD